MAPAAGCHSRAARPRLELADLFRAHGGDLGRLSGPQSRAARAITNCRTPSLGGHLYQCDRCGHREISYNSCRNRHCPKCQTLAKVRWVQAQRALLLPVEYHHVVFTIPQELHPVFLGQPKAAVDLLFAAVSETLQEIALNPRRLGARIGFTAVLHTWTQTLLYHPHVHCIVPGGGLSPDGHRWIPARPGFFLPVRVLSQVFRGKLLGSLQAASAKGRLRQTPPELARLLQGAAAKNWVVYSKPPVAGPHAVLDYLGRYTHRIAFSNERLLSLRDGQVSFLWRDRAHGNQSKPMTLDAREFLRRFLMHVLPSRVVRIRHFGLLANSLRRRQLRLCRQLLNVPHEEDPAPSTPRPPEPWQEMLLRLTGTDVTRCPVCRQGRLELVAVLLRAPSGGRILDRGRSP